MNTVRGFIVLLLALLVACGSYDYYDHIYGDLVHWGSQPDQRFEEVVRACERDLGFELDKDAAIKFIGPMPALKGEAAGYFWYDLDQIDVHDADCLDATALCHEMLHRWFWLHSGKKCAASQGAADNTWCLGWSVPWDPDLNHSRPEWRLLRYGANCP